METKVFKVDRVQLHTGESSCKAFVTLRIADVFILKNIRVVQGKRGLFVAMPSEKYLDKKDHSEKYFSIGFPATKEANQLLQQEILLAYQALLTPAGH